jgi:hypothetical protein
MVGDQIRDRDTFLERLQEESIRWSSSCENLQHLTYGSQHNALKNRSPMEFWVASF